MHTCGIVRDDMFLEIFILIVLALVVLNYIFHARGYRGPRSDHFNGRHFHNLLEGAISKIHPEHPLIERHPRTSFFLKKLRTTWRKRPLAKGVARPAERVYGKEIVVTFVNHSTVLIQTEGLNIITDPVWSRRASPFSFFGPERFVEPGVSLDDLPPIDVLLLTHNHYDHMDIGTLRKIVKKHSPKIFTTLGNSDYLAARGVSGGVDMDWGHERPFSDHVSITCVPAQHFSARALSDRRKTLWAGFVLRLRHGDIYFAGDTGYGPFASHIKKMHPEGFRLAFLPIGAFEPRAFMKTVHIGPDEALALYKDLGVKEAVAIHFGTFDLALDAQDAPVERLSLLLSEEANKDVRFHVLTNGEMLTLG